MRRREEHRVRAKDRHEIEITSKARAFLLSRQPDGHAEGQMIERIGNPEITALLLDASGWCDESDVRLGRKSKTPFIAGRRPRNFGVHLDQGGHLDGM